MRLHVVDRSKFSEISTEFFITEYHREYQCWKSRVRENPGISLNVGALDSTVAECLKISSDWSTTSEHLPIKNVFQFREVL